MSDQTTSVATHAIQRSIAKLAHGVAQEIAQTARDRLDGAMAECVEQFQIKVSGTASDYPGWVELDLNFNQRFTTATGNRESNLQRPQFHFGFELTTGQSQNATVVANAPGGVTRSDPVILHAVVTAWKLDDMAMVSGCTLKLGAVAPGDSVVFTGFVHVSFQGVGAPIQDQDTSE